MPDEVVLKICEVLKVDEGVFSDPDNIGNIGAWHNENGTIK